VSSKIYISPSNQEANLYATGGTNEKEQCHKIARACYNYLKNKGFNVKCTYNDNMYERVKESNVFGADIHLAIHTNATSKHNVTGGTQILLYSLTGERKKVGEAVFNRLSPITPGKSAEKLIEKPSFYEINSAKGITVYCECEFHDTQEGSDFIIKNTKIIGETIAKGICDYYGVNTVEEKTTSENKKTLYTVQVGAFSNKANAIKYADKLKQSGFDAIVVIKN
jgi:N-acetylmuramoyl-L-alanine amidase